MSNTIDTEKKINLSVLMKDEAYKDKSIALADHLGVLLTSDQSLCDLFLCYEEEGLTLSDGNLSLTANLMSMYNRIRPGKLQHEILLKAAKLKGLDHTPVAIDATAGLGEDSIILAAGGFLVHLYEYDPVIAALLSDALERAKESPELSEIASRMILHEEDSVKALLSCTLKPDLILLDPMFPERQKSALVKKKFQLLQRLESPCSDEKDLLSAALSAVPRKIVIKRPIKGPFLAGRKPDYSTGGKAIRYDCIINIKGKEDM